MAFLIKPLIAIGVMIIEIFVAIGYWITNPRPPKPSEGAPPAEFNYVVSRADRSLRAISMQLAGGERFDMLRLEVVPPQARHGAEEEQAVAVASLESDLGRTMRCEFFRDAAPADTPAPTPTGALVRCVTEDGERYEVALEPFAVGEANGKRPLG